MPLDLAKIQPLFFSCLVTFFSIRPQALWWQGMHLSLFIFPSASVLQYLLDFSRETCHSLRIDQIQGKIHSNGRFPPIHSRAALCSVSDFRASIQSAARPGT